MTFLNSLALSVSILSVLPSWMTLVQQQYCSNLANIKAEMADTWIDVCRCYLMRYFEKFFFYHTESFHTGQIFTHFTSSDASDIISPLKNVSHSLLSRDIVWLTYSVLRRIQRQTLQLQTSSGTEHSNNVLFLSCRFNFSLFVRISSKSHIFFLMYFFTQIFFFLNVRFP